MSRKGARMGGFQVAILKKGPYQERKGPLGRNGKEKGHLGEMATWGGGGRGILREQNKKRVRREGGGHALRKKNCIAKKNLISQGRRKKFEASLNYREKRAVGESSGRWRRRGASCRGV